METPATYSSSGVNIEAGDSFASFIKDLVQKENPCPISPPSPNGGFCSLVEIPQIPGLLIASSTDGVGSKVLLANQFRQNGYLTGIGIDMVAMVVNDIITCGAMPLFLLDYFGLGNINFRESFQIIRSVVNGCKEAECYLVGGETSEMPDVYDSGKFDLVGFGVGIVEKEKLLGSHRIKSGDVIIGIRSTGFHSNGYSLIRSVYSNLSWEKDEEIIHSLMIPTRIYVRPMRHLLEKFSNFIHAAAHITGGGLEFNTSRVIPETMNSFIDWNTWRRPDIFNDLQKKGNIEEKEMRKVFNCGIGFTLIVDKDSAKEIVQEIREILQLCAWEIGTVG